MTPGERIRDVILRVNALSLRERALILFAVLAVLVVLWDSLLMLPMRKEAARIEQQRDALTDEIKRLEINIAEISAAYEQDPDRVAREALGRARQAIADLDQRLGKAATELLAPKEMVTALRKVLEDSQGLQLQSLKSLGAQPVIQARPAAADPATGQVPDTVPDDGSAQIYRHRVEMVFTGRYLDALAYLQRLEAEDRRIFWESFRLELLEYPKVQMRLVVYTLGLQQGWLGV